MKRYQKPLRTLAALMPVWLCATVWSAQPVTIPNSGFENPLVAEGSLGPVPASWSAVNGGTIGTVNPSVADLTLEAPEGSNVASVLSNAVENGLSQTLTSTLQADASYVLTAKVANTKFKPDFPGYRVQLVANGTVLAEDDNSKAVAEDAVVTSTVNYTYNAGLHAALVGQPLEIRLLSKGLLLDEEVAFDDVQMSLTLTNPVAVTGGPYVVPYNGTLALNGSGSLPPEGQAIITYEWDLDNDGDYDEAIAGATPASIPYATLLAATPTGYGMVYGPNTIGLRVTDNSSPTPKVATATTTVTVGSPMVIYEPFADSNPTLAGNTPGAGLTGTWDSNANVEADSLKYGALLLGTGNKVSSTNTYGGVSVGSTLTDSGLLADGTELWFSVLIRAGADIGTNGDLGFVLGTDRINSGNNIAVTNSGRAMGVRFKNNLIRAAYWSPTLLNSGGPAAPANTLYLIVGKFIWGATADTVEIYNVGKDLVLGTPASTYTTAGNVDQTLFDTISFGTKATNPLHYFDEIRFGASAADVLPTNSGPPTLASADIVDNKTGGPILESTTVVYTLTFSENINGASVDASDFENGGTAPININSVTTTDNQVFVTVTPAFPGATGTLQLQVKAGAVIEDFGLTPSALNTTSPTADDTVITVNADTVLPTVLSITSPRAATPIYGLAAIPYTVTFDKYFMDDATVTSADFTNAGTATFTIGSVTRISTGTAPAAYSVEVIPTSVGTVQLRLAGTVSDMMGNSVVTPVDDDITYTFASPEPARETITLDSVLDISLRYVAGSTKTFTFNANASDKLVVIGTGEHNFGGSLAGKIISVTYDGVALTKAVEQLPAYAALQTSSSLWYLDNPAAATASANAGDPDLVNPGTIRMTVDGNGTNYVQTAFALSGTREGFDGSSAIAIGSPDVNLFVSSPNSLVVSWLTLGGSGNTANTAETVIADLPVGAVTFGSKRQGNNYAGHALAHSSGLSPGMNAFSFNTALTDVLSFAVEFLAAEAGSGGNTFANWIGTYPGVGTFTGVGDDADGDGIDNGVENFFGTNPSVSNSGLIAGTMNGSTFTFTHPQNATPATDLTAAYQWSKDLATFYASGTTDGGGTTVTFTTQLDTPTPGITTVTATVTGTATSKLFVNVKVTQN